MVRKRKKSRIELLDEQGKVAGPAHGKTKMVPMRRKKPKRKKKVANG